MINNEQSSSASEVDSIKSKLDMTETIVDS